MHKYLILILQVFKLSWSHTVEYRLIFFMCVLIDAGWGIMDLVLLTSLVNTLGSVGHWSRGEVFVVTGLFRIMAIPVWGWLFASFSRLSRLISTGDLDMLLTKPIDTQFNVSFRIFSFNMISAFIIGIVYIALGLQIYGFTPSVLNILALLWLCSISLALIYVLYFATVSITLYFDRLDSIAHLMPHFYDASKFPPEIYSPLLQRILTTMVPLALIISVPVETFFNRPSWPTIIWLHAITVLFFILGRYIWTRGLRRYSSASS